METVAKVLRLRAIDWKTIDEETERLGITTTAFIRLLIRRYFNGIEFSKAKKGER